MRLVDLQKALQTLALNNTLTVALRPSSDFEQCQILQSGRVDQQAEVTAMPNGVKSSLRMLFLYS